MKKTPLGFIIVTHGDMGRELLNVAGYIMGARLDAFRSVKVPFMAEMKNIPQDAATPFQDRRSLIRENILKAIQETDSGRGVVILTDIIGGTSFNVARELVVSRGKGAVIAGVNLPMLLKAAGVTHLSPEEAAERLVARSRAAIASSFPKESK